MKVLVAYESQAALLSPSFKPVDRVQRSSPCFLGCNTQTPLVPHTRSASPTVSVLFCVHDFMFHIGGGRKVKREVSDLHATLMTEQPSHLPSLLSPLSSSSGHAKEALDLARMQEQTVQMEHQTKVKVRQKRTLYTTTASLHVHLLQDTTGFPEN